MFGSYGKSGDVGVGVPFFDENGDGYATLGEAYIKGTFNNNTIILGRQSLDTPFADRDDIGVIPNTFEALTLISKEIENTTIFISHIQRWSGVDSPTPSSFSEVNGDKGVQIIGISYSGIEDMSFDGWFYYMADNVEMSYLEMSYEKDRGEFSYGAKIQYAYQNYENGDYSIIYGAIASLGIKSLGVVGSVAYNKIKGIPADNFWGGGAFFTNAEHNTLRDAGPDGNIILYSLEWDGASVGIDGLSAKANIDSHHGSAYRAREYDIGLKYRYDQKLNISAVYSNVEDRDASFQNLRVFVNYGF